jgi:hypothetical protein
LAQRAPVRAVGLGEEPSPHHRVDHWLPVIPVKLAPVEPGGDTERLEVRDEHLEDGVAIPER